MFSLGGMRYGLMAPGGGKRLGGFWCINVGIIYRLNFINDIVFFKSDNLKYVTVTLLV